MQHPLPRIVFLDPNHAQGEEAAVGGQFSMPRTRSGGSPFFLVHMLTSLSHRVPTYTTIIEICTSLAPIANHLEERLLDQAQARASYTPPFLGSFA